MNKTILYPLLAVMILAAVSGSMFYLGTQMSPKMPATPEEPAPFPTSVVIPVSLRGLGAELTEAGVIDLTKLEDLYALRGGLSETMQKLLSKDFKGPIVMTQENSREMLNFFWAVGLANKNEILEKGEMSQEGDASRFASTGGWSLAKGGIMDHFSAHEFIKLTPDQQMIVDDMSKHIHRPCCNNSTHFPDCNHGMAMLGLLELMASQGMTEAKMYEVALETNALWFPDTYDTISRYLAMTGKDWNDMDPKELLDAPYSSASGYRKILASVAPPNKNGGDGCGV